LREETAEDKKRVDAARAVAFEATETENRQYLMPASINTPET